MHPEQWNQVDSLMQAALARPRGERAAFLRQACMNDENLEREVRSLLAAHDQAGSFLESPAIDAAARALAVESRQNATAGPLAGQTISHYRIVAKIGDGGMGVVYKAEDIRLHRSVALKFLPEAVARDADALRRLQREARVASALNHPNICTIHDIGEQDGRACIVMECLDGTTLRRRIAERPVGIEELVRIGIEIADALEAAHAEGITHRDVKSANIFLTQRGVAKVLDFGLAQVASLRNPRAGAAAVAADGELMNAGIVLGTAGYMSPEQVRAEPLDARTDLFSFGVVLYEMATGTLPFPGDSSAVVFASILNHAPVPLARLNPAVPAELAGIIDKCLEKDRDLRYQHASEVRTDLQRLKRDRDSERFARRAVMPQISRRWRVFFPTTAAVLALLAVGSLYLPAAPRLTEKDTIVLADFTNTTGDPVFDGTLRQGVAIQLEQSPFLKIIDDEQVQRALRLMSLPPGTRISNQIAHDICVRDAAAATIDGSIASLGKSYVVTLEAIGCQGGGTLAREQIQADDKEHVLNAVGAAATVMRAKLGESRNSIQKLNRPLEEVTTPSLEALQNYTAGKAVLTQGRFLSAVPWFERAIALDPNFATAYHYLSLAYNNAGDTEREGEYTRKAFALIDRVSERERHSIAAGYYASTREFDKVVDAFRLGIESYPREWGFHNNLSENLNNLGRFEEGLKEGLVAAEFEPNAEPPYRRLMDAYMCLGQIDEAKKVAEQVRRQGIDGARIHQRFLEIAYIEDDSPAADQEIQWFAGKPEEYLSFGLQAAYLNGLGQRRESSKLYKRAAETALRRDLRDVAAGLEEADARADALVGQCSTVRHLGRPALALAMCGDAAPAEKLAAETSRRFPNGTLWTAVQLPAIRAATELQRGQPAKAVDLLASASPYERAYPEVAYLRGLAYLQLHKGVEAAAEFKKIVDHKGASWGSTWRYPNWGLHYSISYLGLARALILAGDRSNARGAFQDFFSAWKDADSNIAILQQAKAEYAKLP